MPSTDSIAKGAGIKIGFEMPSNKFSSSRLPEQFDLILIINFLEEEVQIPQVLGAVKFRLKEVAIGLEVENGVLSIENNFPSLFARTYSSQQDAPAASIGAGIAGPNIVIIKKVEFYRRPMRDVDCGRKSTSWILRAPNSLSTLSHVTPVISEKAGTVTVESDKETCVVQLMASVEGSKNFYFTHGRALGQKEFRDSIAACIEILLCKQFFKREKSTLCVIKMEVSCEGEITYFPSSSWSEELLSQPPLLAYMYNSAMELSKAGAPFLEIANSFGLDRTTDFTNADLSSLNFSNADLRQLDVTGSILTSTNFHGANLSGMRFSNVDLSYAYFSNADLKGSLFVGCYMPGVIMTDSLLDRHSRFLNIVGMDYQLAISLESAGGIVKLGRLPPEIDQIISFAKDANRLLNAEEIKRICQMSTERGYASSEQVKERAQAVNWLQDYCNAEIYHSPFQYSLVAGSTLPIDNWLSSTGYVLPMSSQAAFQCNGIDAPPRVQACFEYAADSASFE
jgi:uncharacterized protein YjbI with pentapeptide repeats